MRAQSTQLTCLVLLVDDDEHTRCALEFVLEAAGYEVVTADNGRQAIETFDRLAGEAVGVGIVVTDLQLPELDGQGVVADHADVSPLSRPSLKIGDSLATCSGIKLADREGNAKEKPSFVGDAVPIWLRGWAPSKR